MSIIDSSPKPKNVTLNNGAAISSLRSRFGGSSLYLNNGGYASVADNTDFGFGTGDFTVELWVYAYDNNNWRTLFEIGTSQSGLLWRMGTSGDNLYINNSQYNWNPGNVPLNTWSHLALVRNNGTVKVFINGTESLSVSNNSDLGASKPLFIGGRVNGSETFSGFMDEIRITKGIGTAKYTSNFDIKTLHAPFPSTGTPVTPPNAPTELIAGPLGQKINMIWTAPAEDNGGIVTDYSIQYSTDGTNWTDFPHAPSTVPAISVTGLTNGTTYSVRVGAVNYTGIGSYVSESNLVPAEPAVDTNPDPYFYNTSLLLHFDESHNSTNIIDSSYLPKTASVQGDTKISTARNKFGGSSLTLDGNGDYLSYPSHPGLNFNTEDFTIEFWAYCKDQSVSCPTYIANQGGWYEGSFGIRFDNGGSQRFGVYWNPGDPLINSNSTFGFNQWRHVAVVRQGTTVRLYVNGVQEGTASISSSRTLDLCMGGSMRVGFSTWDGGNGYVNDFMDDLRITRGVCRYPDGTTFSLPTLPFSNIAPTISAPSDPTNITAVGYDARADIEWTRSSSDKTLPVYYEMDYSENIQPRNWTAAVSDTRLLLHFNKGDVRGNATLVDYSLYGRNINWNTNNTPAIIEGDSSPGVYQKFGTGCLHIPSNRTGYTSPYIVKVDASNDLNPGTGDYTLEMFLMCDGNATNGGVGRLFGSYNGSSGSYFGLSNINLSTVRIHKYVNGSSVYTVDVGSSNTARLKAGTNVPTQHIAFCRQNGTMRIFLNGVKILENADTNNDNFSSGGLVIMGGESSSHNPNNYILGRIDELKYTIGSAIYTEAFDVLPSSEFKNATVTNLTNNKNYVFRLRAQNSAGYSNYIESSAVLVAPPPSIIVTQQPLNNRVLTSSESVSFSVAANMSDNNNNVLTYQWQKYDTSSDDPSGNYGRTWQNISGATSATLNITHQIFNAANTSSYFSPAGKDAVRCVLTSPYSAVISKTVRLVNMSYMSNIYAVYPDSNRFKGSQSTVYFTNESYPGYYANSNERFSANLNFYSFGHTPDNSWYTGNDTKLKYQYSLDPTTGIWQDTDSAQDINFRYGDYPYNVLTPSVDLSGRVYFRLVAQDSWPYNTINNTSSTNESVYQVVASGGRFYIDFTATAPTSPTNLAADPGDQLVALSWTKGLSGGLPTSTQYTIEYSTDQNSWNTFTNSLPFNNNGIYVTELTNGTTYYFRMKVTNSLGSTSYTSVVSATPKIN